MSNLPIIRLPNFNQHFTVETDASVVAIDAVLSQEDHPLAFLRKKMCPRLQASLVYIREI